MATVRQGGNNCCGAKALARGTDYMALSLCLHDRTMTLP